MSQVIKDPFNLTLNPTTTDPGQGRARQRLDSSVALDPNTFGLIACITRGNLIQLLLFRP